MTPHATAAPPGGAGPPGLLLADPDPALAAAAAARFEAAGVATVVCGDGAEALLQAGARRPRALLLGAPLPVVDCARVTALVARLHPVPVVVAAGADGAAEASAAVAAGATAFVARPYRTQEIIPLLRAPRTDGPLVVGDIELDPVGFHVHVRGRRLRLPVREFMVLHYLMEHAGRVVSRAELTRALWGTDTLDSNTLTVHIRRVRTKLREDGGSSCTIDAIRGMGYRLEGARVSR
ncbi:winged helix-turn-helix transcriptional regulator [Streptomyces indicus]|uniref:DNA-binding response regulator, OmpR family, contains REC and winged-helix (WHTH) domain n=1 Tax=Streptomyces indicus TaxID=417292 RepID=A0A1G8W9N5_9ACTN|nr:response regulator transcription factor [Streptomyces indicus]SDJ75001.1 DNA-binding response regulator, OmpR family, contains REC and winged-helix (wHTH) domain [Streptomyces indicus]